jgi:hypothetical protein
MPSLVRPAFGVVLSVLAHDAAAHAPVYDEDCSGNCCKPKNGDHTFSQAFYLQGSGGVELHIDDIDYKNGEIIHWDVVFRGNYHERPDPADYELYVGCGGCAMNDPYWPEAKLDPIEPLKPVLEPFTATSYYPLYDKDDPVRQFNSIVLENCDPAERHFTIRLKALTSKPLFWAPVLGCPDFDCERRAFDARTILEFPIYILHNQRGAWSEFYAAIWIAAAVAALILLLFFLLPLNIWRGFCCLCSCCGDSCGQRWCKWWCFSWMCGPREEEEEERFLSSSPDVESADARDAKVCRNLMRPWKTMCTRIVDHTIQDENGNPVRVFSWRGLLYGVAVWAMLTSFLNAIFNIHYSIERLDPPFEYEGNGMLMFIWIIVFWGHLAPLVLVGIIWWKATNVAESKWRSFHYGGSRKDKGTKAYCKNYVNCRSPFWAHACWSRIEFFFVGLAGFFWLGTGLFVCPAAIVLASCVRYCGWRERRRWEEGPQFLKATMDEELAAFNARNGPVEKQASSAPVLPMLSMKTNLA